MKKNPELMLILYNLQVEIINLIIRLFMFYNKFHFTKENMIYSFIKCFQDITFSNKSFHYFFSNFQHPNVNFGFPFIAVIEYDIRISFFLD